MAGPKGFNSQNRNDSSGGSAGYSQGGLDQRRDPQTTATTSYLEGMNPFQRSLFRSSSDPLSTGALFENAVSSEIRTGTVLFAMPYIHHYKVSINGGSIMTAIALNPFNLQPLGAKNSQTIATGSTVLMLWPQNSATPYIMGVVPYLCSDDKKNSASVLQSGGNSVVLKQSAYRQLPSQLVTEGEIQNYGCGRPIDGTNFEYSITTETGTSFLLDSYQAALSIDEGCGLFLNWFDNYCRLAGFQLDVQSYAEHVMQRYDEGETLAFRGSLIYPWESVGSYAADSTDFTEKYDPKDYQTDPEKPFGFIDLPESGTDLAPIYRYMEYGGYVGQGNTRLLMKPAKKEGQRHVKDSDVDYGLWHESIALDGSYTLRSAKSVFIGKYSLIPVPKRTNPPENQSEGDDYRKDNYKFSGRFSGGDPHYVTDLQPENRDKAEEHLIKASGVLDLLAYNYNWKSTHPFYYHKEDYNFPEEGELSKMGEAYYEPDYSELESQSYLDSPDSKKLYIDSKYQEVEYFQSLSFITLLDDGGVVIGDGYGSQITMTGGQIRLEAPGEVVLMPGTRAFTLCDEFIVRAKSNVELSSSKKDIRLKAERNMQLLSGNDGKGGMLIENKSKGSWKHQYENKYGDDVTDSGITLMAKYAGVGAVGKDVYIRSGAIEGEDGKLILDSSQGRENVVMYGKAFHVFESEGMTLWEEPEGETPGAMKETHRFHSSATMHSSPLYVEGDIVTVDGNIVAKENVLARKNILCGEKLGHYGSMFVADLSQSDVDIRGQIEDITTQVQEGIDRVIDMGELAFKGGFKEMYSDNHLGNNDFITNIMGFSFNDKPTGKPYGYTPDKFKILEARWQRTVLGSPGTGKPWTETSVLYQGLESYPWPGKENWTGGEAYLRGPVLKFFGKGRSTMDEDSVEMNDIEKEAPDGSYTLISGD